MIPFLISVFSELFISSYSKTQYQLRDCAGLSKKFRNKKFGLSLFFFDSTELLQIFQETYEIDNMWHSLAKIYLLFIIFCFIPFFQFIKLFFFVVNNFHVLYIRKLVHMFNGFSRQFHCFYMFFWISVFSPAKGIFLCD